MNVLKSLLVALTLTWVIGCENSAGPDMTGEKETTTTLDDVKKDVGQAAETTRDYSATQTREANDMLQARMQNLNDQIEQLKESGGELSGEAQQQWQDRMAKLKDKREQLQGDLDRLSNASGEAWQDLRMGIDQAMQDLDAATEDAKKHFK